MAVKVVEVDLTQTFPSLRDTDIKHYSHIQLLVRWNKYPVGYAWIDARSKRFLEEDYLKFEIERQLFHELERHKLKLRLSGALPSNSLADLPTLTVAVCTRNRPESLRKALRSLVELDYPPEKLDLLVVDNAPPDDATKLVVAEFPVIRYAVEPRPGLDWARNCAIEFARGQIIAYTDDDTKADRYWAQNLASHFANPKVGCVTGLVVPAERETDAQNLFEEYNNGFGKGFESHYYTLGVRKHWSYFPLGAGNFGTGCNMAYRKEIFSKVGSFDVALDVGTPTHGAGDLDMFYRVVRAGYILVYEPAAIIHHYHRPDYQKLKQQIHDFGRGVYAFWTKTFLSDPEMRWPALKLAMIWYGQGYLRKLLKRKGSHRRLALIEAYGALVGPFAYFEARKVARKLSRQKVNATLNQPETADLLLMSSSEK
ncbi:MAG TPA: glycosyltransferase [Chloroflexia bacterium]|nr:glycosyltransferase [Chloroflexia bacterium]